MAYQRKKPENEIKEEHLNKMKIYLSKIDSLKPKENE